MPRSSPSWFLSSSRNFHSTTPGFCWRAETASARSRWRHTWEASVKNGTIKQHVIRQSCLSKRVNVSRSRLAARQRTRASPGVTWALTSLRVGILGVEEIDKSVVELPAIRARALVAAGRCKSNTTTVSSRTARARADHDNRTYTCIACDVRPKRQTNWYFYGKARTAVNENTRTTFYLAGSVVVWNISTAAFK